jgi:hypothetical protein
MLPTMLAQVIPPRDDNESDAHYAARIQVAHEAFDPFGPWNPVEQMLALQAVAAAMGREMRVNAKALERHQKPERPARKECAQNLIQPEPEPEDEPAVDPLGGRERRQRILDSAPVQAFWATHHSLEVDMQEVWDEHIASASPLSMPSMGKMA